MLSSQAQVAPDPGAAPAAVPTRPLPQDLHELGVPEIFLANLTLKHCFYLDTVYLSELSDRLKLSTTILTQLLDYLRKEKYLEIRGPDPLKPVANPLALTNRFAITELRKRRAGNLLEYDAYVGPAPVSLEDYWQQVTNQSFKLSTITQDKLARVFEGLVITPDLLEQLGPATVSGKPLFLYGPPGNGKTTIAVRLGQIWDDAILVPFALYVEGNVIRVFDEITHHPIKKADSRQEQVDRRWVPCRRPTVLVGASSPWACWTWLSTPSSSITRRRCSSRPITACSSWTTSAASKSLPRSS